MRIPGNIPKLSLSVLVSVVTANMSGLAEESRKLEDLQQHADPESKEQADLIHEMRAHLKKLQDMRRNEDPRLTFSTPEFKEAQRVFTDNFKKNFNRPVEWAMVKEHPWSTPQLRRLDVPVDVNGNPWTASPK